MKILYILKRPPDDSTKKIIDEHKGSIYVDSRVGEGTTFTVCLPRA